MFSSEFCKISNNAFSYRTPLVAISLSVIFFKSFLSILGNFSENVFFQWVVFPKLRNKESVVIPANYCRYQYKCEVESSSKGQNIFVKAK